MKPIGIACILAPATHGQNGTAEPNRFLRKSSKKKMSAFRSFAVVPAAGRSRRMGTAKLLLEVGGIPIIDRVLEAWVASQVDVTAVVIRACDSALRSRCRKFDVLVVEATEDPPQMRDSVQFGLDFVAEHFAPKQTDAWLVAPADIPGISTTAINLVLSSHQAASPEIIVPQINGRRGHPVLLPWNEVERFKVLPADVGLNALVNTANVCEVAVNDVALQEDVDTPADFRRIAERHLE